MTSRVKIWTSDRKMAWNHYPRCPVIHRRRKTVLQFSRDMISRSSINGLSNIARARNWIWRILWIITFTCCLLGFTYHATLYFSVFFSYPTSVDVKVENKGFLEFPAVTICNNNRFRKSAFMAYRQQNDLQFDSIEEIAVNLNKSVKIKIGHRKEDLIIACKIKGRHEMEQEECLKRFYLHYIPDHGNCYVFNAVWNSEQKKIVYAYDSDMWNPPTELVLDIDVQYSEYLDEERSAAILVTFHTPDAYPDPSSETVTARAGHRYSFGMRQSTTKLLPFPYQSNCTDYSQLPWSKNYRGTPHPKICTQECSRDMQLNKCRCISANLTKLYDDSPCEGDKVYCADEIEEKTMDYCRTLCRVPCVRKSYETTTDSSSWPKKNKMMFLGEWANRSLSEARKTLVRLKIFMRTMEHTTYEHLPKYAPVEIFSHLGGYISLWLGFSVLAVWELLEMCVQIVHRALCK